MIRLWKWFMARSHRKALLVGGAFFVFLLCTSLDILLHLFILVPSVEWNKMAAGQGAQGPHFQIRSQGGVPYLWSYDLPYPGDFDETSHQTQSLAGKWKFILDPTNTGEKQKWYDLKEVDSSWKDIQIPSAYNGPNSQEKGHHGISWFFLQFPQKVSPSDDHFFRLCFRGVYLRSKVWCNGQFLGEREGGYTPFYFDVTRLIKEQNTLVLRVDNQRTESSLPPKLRQQDTPCWPDYGGIYRDVYIEKIPRQYLFKVVAEEKILPTKKVQVNLSLLTHNHLRKEPYRIIFHLRTDQGEKLFETALFQKNPGPVDHHSISFTLPTEHLWTPENKKLLTFEFLLSGKDLQEKTLFKKGLRVLEAHQSGLYLNGKPLFLKGISQVEDDPYWANSPPQAAIERDLDLIQEMGANYIRLAHYPHSSLKLRLARDRGLLVSEELPFYQVGMGWVGWLGGMGGGWLDFPGSTFGLNQLLNKDLLLNSQRELVEMIERDRHNPSLILWYVGNESYSLGKKAGEVYEWLRKVVRTFDKTRPVTFAEVTYGVSLLDELRSSGDPMDVLSVNVYYGWYFGKTRDLAKYLRDTHGDHPEKPMILSEFGAGAALGRTEKSGKWKKTPLVKGKAFSEEYQSGLLSQYIETARQKAYIVGLSPWVFADFPCTWFPHNPVAGYNLKGVLNQQRKPKKGYFKLKELYGKGK